MDAPLYPPAAAYVKPVAAAYRFGVDTLSVKEAVDSPAIKQIMLDEAPSLTFVLRATQTQTHISNWSIRSLATLTLVTPAQLARIEQRLLALPAGERSSL